VLQAETQIEYAEYARKSTYSDYAPQVYGTASAGKSGDSWPPSENTWNAGVSLTLPLIKGGERIYQNSKAEAAYRQAVADRDSALSSASLALARKWTALLYAIDHCKVREKSLLASEERSRIAQARYNIGDITFDNWIIIENELVDAKKNYLNARASVLDAEAEWRNSQGVTLDNDTRE
jgi:outer membrane protein TolC